MEPLQSCPACGASVGRNQFSDYWRCDNNHVIYRGVEKKAPRYEIRSVDTTSLSASELKEAEGFHAVWDLLVDEPFYNRASDEYAWLISEAQARSLRSRLLGSHA